MKFTVAHLLDQLSSSEILPLASLETSLGLTEEEDRQQLRIGLDALQRLALIEESEEGLRRQEAPDLIAARLRCSSKGFCFALREDGGDDIYVREHQLNHAWNGDRVLVKITREGGRRRSPEGGGVLHLLGDWGVKSDNYCPVQPAATGGKLAGRTFVITGTLSEPRASIQALIEEALVVTTPGSAFGQAGEGHVRFSIAERTTDLEKMVERLAKVAPRL